MNARPPAAHRTAYLDSAMAPHVHDLASFSAFPALSRLARAAPSLALLLPLFSGCAQSQSANERTPTGARSGGSGSLALGGSAGVATEPNSSGGTPSGHEVGDSCRASAECGPPTPYCLTKLGHCVECLSHVNCQNSGSRFCNTTTNTCVQCVTDVDCPSDVPYCSPAGACVQCLSTRNCGTGDVVCDPLVFRCVPTCLSEDDCQNSVARPYCDVKRNVCVECDSDEQCPAASPHCEGATGTCEKCLVDDDCPASEPHCDEASPHRCVECRTSADCVDHVPCTAGQCAKKPT